MTSADRSYFKETRAKDLYSNTTKRGAGITQKKELLNYKGN
jgi:hypothetical protein